MTLSDWLSGIATAYGVTVDNISVSQTAAEYIAILTPPSFTADAIANTATPSRNIVELRILKSAIIP